MGQTIEKKLSLVMESKDDYRERKKMCYNGWFYAIQRMDLLIISISGAGVLVILEALKFSYDKPTLHSMLTLKWAGAMFVLTIIVNFISQITGKKANFWDMLHCDAKIDASDPATPEETETIIRYDCKADSYSYWTDKLNSASIVTMCIALVTLLSYFWVTF